MSMVTPRDASTSFPAPEPIRVGVDGQDYEIRGPSEPGLWRDEGMTIETTIPSSYSMGVKESRSQDMTEYKPEDIKTVEYGGYKITYEDSNGKVADYLDAFKVVVDKYKINVTVYNVHDRNNLPYVDTLKSPSRDTLFITNFAVPIVAKWKKDRFKSIKKFKEMSVVQGGENIILKLNDWEVKLEKGQSDSYAYDSGIAEEFCIRDDTNINILGTVDANKIFISFDLMHSSSDDSKRIFLYIVDKAMQVMTDLHDELFGAFDQDTYLQFCNKAFLKMVQEKRRSILAINRQTLDFEHTIFCLQRDKWKLVNELRHMDENEIIQEKKEEYSELVKLASLGGYKEFKIIDGYLYAYTNEITVEYREKNYLLGEFEVKVGGERGELHIRNLTNQRKGYNHPHVNKEGHCCLGNISSDVQKMLGAEQYLMAFQMLYNFLASYDDKNPYTKIDLWDTEWDGKTVVSTELSLADIDEQLERDENDVEPSLDGSVRSPRVSPDVADNLRSLPNDVDREMEQVMARHADGQMLGSRPQTSEERARAIVREEILGVDSDLPATHGNGMEIVRVDMSQPGSESLSPETLRSALTVHGMGEAQEREPATPELQF